MMLMTSGLYQLSYNDVVDDNLVQVHLEGVWVDRRRDSSCLDSAQLYLHNASTHYNFGEVWKLLEILAIQNIFSANPASKKC